MSRKILMIALVALAVSCGQNHGGILSMADMKVVMWDMLNADSWYFQASIKDSTAAARKLNVQLYQQVFLQHDITREQFYASYKYYQLRPEKMQVLMDSVEAYGNRVKGQQVAIPKRPFMRLPKKPA